MLLYDAQDVKKVYVSSARRGFLAVADNPIIVTTLSGTSSNNTIIGLKRVERIAGTWVYAEPDASVEWWMASAFNGALALKGAEPWRLYEMDAHIVGSYLDGGAFPDDIRGFSNRCEPWQPMTVDAQGDKIGYVPPAEAAVWERDDGWRICRNRHGAWRAEGGRCNADPSTLEWSPNHFDPLEQVGFGSHLEAMEYVDKHRPWE